MIKMTIGGMPLCLYCDRMNDEDKENFNWVCAAFPNGIPIEIIDLDVVHDHPVDGDQGRFYSGMLTVEDILK